jgi:hypothetical protein
VIHSGGVHGSHRDGATRKRSLPGPATRSRASSSRPAPLLVLIGAIDFVASRTRMRALRRAGVSHTEWHLPPSRKRLTRTRNLAGGGRGEAMIRRRRTPGLVTVAARPSRKLDEQVACVSNHPGPPLSRRRARRIKRNQVQPTGTDDPA